MPKLKRSVDHKAVIIDGNKKVKVLLSFDDKTKGFVIKSFTGRKLKKYGNSYPSMKAMRAKGIDIWLN